MGISSLPNKILVEGGAISKIKEIIADIGSKPVIFADNITRGIGGEQMSKTLNCNIVLIGDATTEEVERVQKENADCIIAFGGGKVIDVGKMAAHNKKIPFISCPTACSHDGIVSGNASITVNGQKVSFSTTPPIGIIADLDIILKSPYRLTAAGAAEVICKYSSVADWKLAYSKGIEEYSDAIASMILGAADTVSDSVKKIKKLDQTAIKDLVWSLLFTSFSMSLFGSSRPASGAEHMFSHSLDKIGKFGLHGEQVGIGAIFFSYLHGLKWKKIKTSLKNVGAPTTTKQIGVDKEIFIEAMLKAKDIRKRYTIMDEKQLSRELILKVGEETGII